MKATTSERLLLRIFYEVAAMIGVSRTTAYALVKKSSFSLVRIGGLLRVPADALRKLIEERAVNAGEADAP